MATTDHDRTPEVYSYLHTLDGVASKLATLAERIHAVGKPTSSRLAYSSAAASVVSEVTATLANLNLWPLIVNAAEADRAIGEQEN